MFKMFDTVELMEDYKDENASPKNDTIYKKGTIGHIVEIYNDEWVMLEVDGKVYDRFIPDVPTKILKKI